METALLWGDSPFRFWERPAMERAIMTAHFREKGLRKAHLDHIQHQLSEKNSKPARSAAMPDTHSAFFGA